MENLLDILIPVIAVLLFALGKLFGPKEDEQDNAPPPQWHEEEEEAPETVRERSWDESQQDTEDRRADALREEIRRKIEARRAARSIDSTGPATHPNSQPSASQRPAMELQRPVAEPQSQQNDYKQLLEKKLRDIELTKKKAEEIRGGFPGSDKLKNGPLLGKPKSKAAATSCDFGSDIAWATRAPAAHTYAIRIRGGRSPAVRKAIASLRDPGAARSAILLREILDTPKGLRRESAGSPPE